MTTVDAASVRTVAVQLRALSADEDNQPIIAREDGCLRALISFVTGDDGAVAAIAVAALKNLAAHPDNYALFRAEDELLDGLKDLLVDPETEMDTRRDIFDILEELTDEEDDDEMDELDELEAKAGLTNDDDGTASAADDNDPSLLPVPVTTRLHIPSLSDDVFCIRVEQLIIRKRGVISVVFEIGAELAVVYARLPSDELAAFITTMTGVEVDVLPPVAEEESDEEEDDDSAEKENGSGQPGYLDETGERFRDVAKKNAKKKNNVSHGATSLAERLEAQRQEESKKKARADRLTGAIGRGFTSGWGLW
jgi:hypothetical protein